MDLVVCKPGHGLVQRHFLHQCRHLVEELAVVRRKLVDRGDKVEQPAGIVVRDLVGGADFGWCARAPCSGKVAPDIVPCAKYEPHTREELAEQERANEAAMARLLATFPLVGRIKKDHKGKNANGSDPCPVPGCGGVVSWRIASFNGHVWMRCSAKDCIAFME